MQVGKVTFISNFLNHHQLPLSNEFCRILGDGYKFVCTEPLSEERVQLGYHDMNHRYPFCLNAYESREKWDECEKVAFKSDVVIFNYGSVPISLIERRLKAKKLTFFYLERILKKKRYEEISFSRKMALLWHHARFSRNNIYILCASAYTSYDFSRLRKYGGKMFKWGYFPEVGDAAKPKDLGKDVELIWVGRFIDWKHPEQAICAVDRLVKEGCQDLHLQMIGTGPMFDRMIAYVGELGVDRYVSFEKSMSPEQVREFMDRADILISTSDRNEGWGAVLNEGMSSSCVPISGHLVGAAPYLIKNGENGFIHKDGDLDGMVRCLGYLLDHPEERKAMAAKASETMRTEWNCRVAVNRFLETLKIADGKLSFLYKDGPMSEAVVINEDYTTFYSEGNRCHGFSVDQRYHPYL